jgi:hypothetical protein
VNEIDNSHYLTSFDNLPLFASDKEIAVAIVGKERAPKWLKEGLPYLAVRRGFPPIDAFHGGRAVPLVRRFYEDYLGPVGLHPGYAVDGKENWEERRKPKDRKPGDNVSQSVADKRARAKSYSDAWAEKKRQALEEFRAKKAADEAAKKD